MNQQTRHPGPMQRLAMEQAKRRHRHWLWLAAAIVAILAIVGTVLYVVTKDDGTTPPKPVTKPVAASQDGLGLVVGTGPVTVELYSDFLCPGCQAFETDARDVIQTFVTGKKITFIYRPVAFLDRVSTNEYSSRAANAAACASDVGKLLPLVNVLFDNQPAEGGAGHDNEAIIRLAASAGITEPAFGQCVREDRYGSWVDSVTASMQTNSIPGTPYVTVAGTVLQKRSGAALAEAVNAAVGPTG